MLFEVYRCVQLIRWSVVCGCVLDRGRAGKCGVFCRLCVGMILGWDFYWFGVGRGCDVFHWGGRLRKGRSWGRVDVLVLWLRCRRCVCTMLVCICVELLRSVVV